MNKKDNNTVKIKIKISISICFQTLFKCLKVPSHMPSLN